MKHNHPSDTPCCCHGLIVGLFWLVGIGCVWLVGGPAAAEDAAPGVQAEAIAADAPVSDGSDGLGERADEVMQQIQERFYRDRVSLYRQAADERGLSDMWTCGVVFSALVASARQSPEVYRPVLDAYFAAINEHYWDQDAPVPGYEPFPIRPGQDNTDKYYDDNAWMAITFVEAFELTADPAYLDRAKQAIAFTLSGEDQVLGGGIWWHEHRKDNTKNTCCSAPAALACLAIAEHDPAQREHWVRTAQRLVAWTHQTLQADDGRFDDRIKADSGRVIRGKLTYNAGLMIRANLGLHRATGEQAYLDEAIRIGEAAEAFISPRTGFYRDRFRFSHLLIEADLELWEATGRPRYYERARRAGEGYLAAWRDQPPRELIEAASIARTLRLLAEAQVPGSPKPGAE